MITAHSVKIHRNTLNIPQNTQFTSSYRMPTLRAGDPMRFAFVDVEGERKFLLKPSCKREKMKWSICNTRRKGVAGPGKRWGHTCKFIKSTQSLYVFGGYGKDNRQTDDVHVFDTGKQTWSKPMVKGTPPSPRDSHSCTAVGTCLYIFGGTDGNNPLGDLHIFDTVTNTWLKPDVEGDGPGPREGHSAALIGTDLYIFGGCGKTGDDSKEVHFNELYILDTVKMAWRRATTKGTPPAPRDSHACLSWNDKLVIVGGEDAADSYLSDIHMLNTDTMEWIELQVSGEVMHPRAGHVAASFDKYMFVFGGFADERKLFGDLHMLNLESGVWAKVAPVGVGPSARFSVAADCIDAGKGILIFIGGCNQYLEAMDDVYCLDTGIHPNSAEMQVEKVVDSRPEKHSFHKELKRKELKRKFQVNQQVLVSSMAECQANQIIAGSCNKDEQLRSPPVELKRKVAPNISSPSPAIVLTGDISSLYKFNPVDEKIFEAKVTDLFHYGYTIESTIEGKLLRGLLFSYKPGFAHAVHAYLTRKKILSDPNAAKAKYARKGKPKAGGTKTTALDGGQIVPSNHIVDEQGPTISIPVPNQQAALSNLHHAYVPQQPQVQQMQLLSSPVHPHYEHSQQFLPSQPYQYVSPQPQHSLPSSQSQQPGVRMPSPMSGVLQAHPRNFVAPGFMETPSIETSSGHAGIYGIRPLPPASQGMQHPQH